MGSVEFVAPVEYMVRPPQAPVYVFVIDVSAASVSRGALSIAAHTIQSVRAPACCCATHTRAGTLSPPPPPSLPRPPFPPPHQVLDGMTDDRIQVGFVTFDTAVHFYSLRAGLSAPQMLVVPDIDDLFMPVPEVRRLRAHRVGGAALP